MNTNGRMSKQEREELQKINNARAALARKDIEQRAAELMADVAAKLAAIYYPKDHPVWKEAHDKADKVVAAADADIARLCQELGIPEEFRPGLNVYWHSRGENAMASRRAELLAVARTRIEADKKKAQLEIERAALNTRTQLAATGLTSEEAMQFLANMPTAEQLMRPIDLETLKLPGPRVDPILSRYLAERSGEDGHE